MKVYKYQMRTNPQQILMPVGARILSAQMQHGSINIWAVVDPAAAQEVQWRHVARPEDLMGIRRVAVMRHETFPEHPQYREMREYLHAAGAPLVDAPRPIPIPMPRRPA